MSLFRKEKEQYASLSIAAAPGTHAAVLDMVQKHCSKDSSILELAAYKGAFLQRLRDNGFNNLAAADLDNHLALDGIPHMVCDFNLQFHELFEGKKFDCIIACEVIEHLDDPRHFLKQCNKLLTENGIIIISTPNIAFYEGRLKFFLKGELWGFGANNYKSQRHISAISHQQFPLLLQETGFATKELYTAASFATPLRWIATALLWIPMRLLFGPNVLGESTICVGVNQTNLKANFLSEDLWKSNS